MFSLIKGLFGGLWSYVAIAAAAVGAVLTIYLKGRSAGKDAAEEDAREAVTDATEDLKEDADRIQKKVDEDSKKVDIYRDIN